MMDLKEIIKWFIPCFHILLYKKVKMFKVVYISCLFLLFFIRPGYGAIIDNSSEADTKNIDNYKFLNESKVSEYYEVNDKLENEDKSMDIETSIGRTFGRPLKKMVQALIPLAFQVGAATTWMIVAAIVGFKTLLVSLAILKLLLLGGALKVGALIGTKTHDHHHGWEPQHHGWAPSPQKEIHVHIHGQPTGVHEEHISSWNRDGATDTSADTNSVNIALNPYAAGPQTISTPYGNYVRVDSSNYNQVSSNLNT